MVADRPLAGIALIAGFCVLAPLGDALAKLLGDTVPLGMILLARFSAQAVLLVPLVWLTGGSLLVSRRVMLLTVLRTLLHIVGLGSLFAALRFLPLADAIAIAFVMPFIVLLLGKTLMGEEVGPRRLAACGVGFAGTLLVVQPSFAAVGAPALLPLLAAVIFAFFMLITRTIAKDNDPLVLQAVSGLVATLALGLVLWGFSGRNVPILTLVAPTKHETLLLVATGIAGTMAHLLMVWALRFAPSATLAPIQYLEIPFATLIGFLIFGDLPNGVAALGIAITIGAGLYIVMRERMVARMLRVGA